MFPRLKRGRSRIEIEVEEREEGDEEEGDSMAVDDRDLRLTIRGTANGASDRKVFVKPSYRGIHQIDAISSDP